MRETRRYNAATPPPPPVRLVQNSKVSTPKFGNVLELCHLCTARATAYRSQTQNASMIDSDTQHRQGGDEGVQETVFYLCHSCRSQEEEREEDQLQQQTRERHGKQQRTAEPRNTKDRQRSVRERAGMDWRYVADMELVMIAFRFSHSTFLV